MIINFICGDLINLEEVFQEFYMIWDFLCWLVSFFNEYQVVQGYGYVDVWDEVVVLVLYVLYLFWDIDIWIQDVCLFISEKEVVCVLLEKCVVECIFIVYLIGIGWFVEIFFKVD